MVPYLNERFPTEIPLILTASAEYFSQNQRGLDAHPLSFADKPI
jgi:hypothetical protein